MNRDGVAVPAHGVLVSGWFVGAISTLVERHILAARAGSAPVDRRLLELLDALRGHVATGCAAQPAQPREDVDERWWPSDDEIETKEAAMIMDCSETNVRKRAGGSLPAVKVGGRWVFSRLTVLAIAEAERGR